MGEVEITGDELYSRGSESSSEEGQEEQFVGVLAALDKEQLVLLVTTIIWREFPSEANVYTMISIGSPTFGSYHVVFPLLLNDFPHWVVKIPGNGTAGQWTEECVSRLISEVKTMKMLKRETTIPVPDVIEFSSITQNSIGCPFIIMSHVSGRSLYDVWFGHHLRGLCFDVVHEHRIRALKGIAMAMVQLGQFTFCHGGRPLYDGDGNLVGSGSVRVWDWRASSPERFEYVNVGPWNSTNAYYTSRVDWYPNSNPDAEPVLRGEVELMRKLLGWIPEPNGTAPFVLSHPDLNIQNIIVSDDGKLQGIIDWDGVIAVPRTCGNEAYPLWLIRDWFPDSYAYDDSMDRGVEPEGCWEDSPKSLKNYRNAYRDMITELLSQRSQAREPSLCGMSLVTVNLSLAVHGGMSSWSTMEKIIGEMRAVTKQSEIPEEFGDLLWLMGNDQVSESLLEEMKHTFEHLLTER